MPEKPSQPLSASCAQCGALLRAGAQFCTSCGAPVAAAPARPKGSTRTTQRKSLWLLLGAGLVIIAVVAVFALLNGAPQPAPSASVTIPTVAVAENVPFPDVARVTVEDAHVMAMTGDAVIVDVRDKPFFDASHARGALSLPLGELPSRTSELPKDKAILTYCT